MTRRSRRLLAAAAVVCGGIVAVPAIQGQTSDEVRPEPETDKAVAAAASAGAPPAAPGTDPLPAEAAAPEDAGALTHVANVPGRTGGHVVAEGGRLYVGAYGLGLRIFDISEDPATPTPIGEYVPGPVPAEGDPGARADAVPDAAVLDGRHIVALGGTRRASSTTQTEFIDVTDPTAPRLLWRFRGAADGEAHNADIADARKWWLPSGGAGENGLRIYDMSPLLGEEPAAPEVLFRGDPAALWEQSPHRGEREVGPKFSHTHDIEIYLDHPVRVSDGEAAASERRGRGWAKGHFRTAVADEPTYVARDIALLAEGGAYLNGQGNTGSVFVIDITDPRDPVVLNRWRHEAGEGHHPIRYFHEVQLLDGQRDIMIVTDEDLHNGCNAGGVYFLRVSADLTQATELSEWFIGTGTPAPVCSSHVFSSHGDHVFVGSYNAGLQVIDASDPADPQKAAQSIIPGNNYWGALWHDGYIYAGDFGARGLDVFTFEP